jgi:hypothetical protein
LPQKLIALPQKLIALPGTVSVWRQVTFLARGA